ncbi:putative transcriptional regulator [Caudoviricetes sp.]|nr:putative transcriptional regulator [Caudoviricetes sp.]UOF81487.1 putative transcriptional regulator [Caudoviricetes sp.]
MTKAAFEKIAGGLREALAVAKGKAGPARWRVPPELDVKAIRKKTGFSQDAFASTFGFSQEQVRAWEQNRNRPTQGLRAYLLLIEANHVMVLQMLEASKSRISETKTRQRKRA